MTLRPPLNLSLIQKAYNEGNDFKNLDTNIQKSIECMQEAQLPASFN